MPTRTHSRIDQEDVVSEERSDPGSAERREVFAGLPGGPGLDEDPLEGAYPYLWLDAKQVKVRDHGRVVSKATVVAYAVHESGVREVIGLDVGEVESGAFWVEFLRGLKQRGLDGVRLAVSDQHEGLKGAIARVGSVGGTV